jgi:hypothetical protein
MGASFRVFFPFFLSLRVLLSFPSAFALGSGWEEGYCYSLSWIFTLIFFADDRNHFPVSAPFPIPVSAPFPIPVSVPFPIPVSAPFPIPVSAPFPIPVSAPVPHSQRIYLDQEDAIKIAVDEEVTLMDWGNAYVSMERMRMQRRSAFVSFLLFLHFPFV